MITVLQLLNQKDRTISSIHPDATVFDAITKMAENNIGSLLVMDGEELVGIITERDYTRNVQRPFVAHDAGQGDHGTARHIRAARTNRRAMHGSHERQARAPSASARR